MNSKSFTRLFTFVLLVTLFDPILGTIFCMKPRKIKGKNRRVSEYHYRLYTLKRSIDDQLKKEMERNKLLKSKYNKLKKNKEDVENQLKELQIKKEKRYSENSPIDYDDPDIDETVKVFMCAHKDDMLHMDYEDRVAMIKNIKSAVEKIRKNKNRRLLQIGCVALLAMAIGLQL